MIIDQDFAGVRLRGSRRQQQDYYAFCPVASGPGVAPGMLLALADGAGGLIDGQRASQAAVEGFADGFFASTAVGEPRLEAALDAANLRVGSGPETSPPAWEDATTASTLVAIHATAEWFEWISVGDSLLLQASPGAALRRCNADHSLRDDLDRGDARRSSLRSALTGAPIPLVDRGRAPWRRGDWLLAGSDGLLTLSEATIGVILGREGLSAAQGVQALAGLLRQEADPHQDNATVALLCNRLGDE